MPFFLALFAIPFLLLGNTFVDATYAQSADADTEEEIERADDETVLLSHDKDASSGKISKTSTKGNSQHHKALKTDLKLEKASLKERLQRDFAEMRMIQLANNIAADLGMVVNISLPR